MATPTQTQPYSGNPYPTPGSQSGPSSGPQQAYGQEQRNSQSAQGSYSQTPSNANPGPGFDKYCIIHIATTCDEHGVYVTKDSAEVIEIGWVVVDARDPALPEVCDMRVTLIRVQR